MSQPRTIFQLPYLKEQLKKVSDMNGEREAGKYFCNFNHSPQNQALFILLLEERIREMEGAEQVKPVETNY